MNVWDLIYPRTCVSCGKKGRYFCQRCIKTVKINHWVSRDGTSLFEYRGVMRTAVGQLKYRFLKDMAREFQELIRWGLRQKLRDRSEWRLKEFLKLRPKLQPMPLYKTRLNWRGFNQAEILAKLLAAELGLELTDSLIRVKKTKPQMSLKREQRLKNIRGVFEVKPEARGGAVLVVDDVWTSGATIREAMKTLQEKGNQVYGLTLAR